MLIAVKREDRSRGGSVALHQINAGDHVKIGKPRNLLAIADRGDRHVLVAGGIGVTPLLSDGATSSTAWGEEFELHYFARYPRGGRVRGACWTRGVSFVNGHLHFGVPAATSPPPSRRSRRG